MEYQNPSQKTSPPFQLCQSKILFTNYWNIFAKLSEEGINTTDPK